MELNQQLVTDNVSQPQCGWGRVVGVETEFGILDLDQPRRDPVGLSVDTALEVAQLFAEQHAAGQVVWDYGGEDPLNDMRGTRLERANAHPSLLTDDPNAFAPGGSTPVSGGTFAAAASHGVSPLMTTVLCPNGGRFYVDHAHPEYSSPEVLDARQAALWDQAGDQIAVKVMERMKTQGRQVVLYKNNTDSKGAAYGAHENYQISRQIPFRQLTEVLVPFLVTRPIICGSGRVGLGQHSEKPGFQISQRADFIADLVGLQTTFNRPIINTRDEPHASKQWRRLHVINGDANRFEYSTYLKVASLRSLLWAVETQWRQQGCVSQRLRGLNLATDPVAACWEVSRDLDFAGQFACRDGKERNSWQLQWDLFSQVGTIGQKWDMPADIASEWTAWGQILELLEKDREKAGRRVEWLAKWQLFDALKNRLGTGWDNPKLAALDIQWADLRPGFSPVDKLLARHAVESLSDSAQIQVALFQAPRQSRAALRAQALKNLKSLRGASWQSLVVCKGGEDMWRLSLGDPQICPDQELLDGLTDEKVIQILAAEQDQEGNSHA